MTLPSGKVSPGPTRGHAYRPRLTITRSRHPMTLPWGKDITVRFGSKMAPAYKGRVHAVTTGLHVRIIDSAGEGTAERRAARRAEQAPRNSTFFFSLRTRPRQQPARTPERGNMINTASRPAKSSAESLRQARTFDSNKRHYVSLGLCSPCAAQAAWGHQLGFSKSKSPCQGCQPLVDSFPVRRSNKWRSHSQRRGAKFLASVRPDMGQ